SRLWRASPRGRFLSLGGAALDEAGAVVLLLVAGGAPERDGRIVAGDDDGGEAARPERPQPRLAGVDEGACHTAPAVLGQHCQAVEAAPPAVPRSDQRSRDRAVEDRD